MSKKVVFSPLANHDLESIWSYLAEECENPRAAWQNGDRGLADAESRQSATPTSCKDLGPESGRIPYKR